MTQHDDTVALRHMLDDAHTARRLATGRTRQDLDADEMLHLALRHSAGEAAACESTEKRYTTLDNSGRF